MRTPLNITFIHTLSLFFYIFCTFIAVQLRITHFHIYIYIYKGGICTVNTEQLVDILICTIGPYINRSVSAI